MYLKNYWLWKTLLLKCIKCPVSENPSEVNVLTSSKSCSNLEKTVLSLFFIVLSHIELEKVSLVRFDIWGLLIITLTLNNAYVRPNRERLPLPLQIQFFGKPKTFCSSSVTFLETILNFQHFQKTSTFTA